MAGLELWLPLVSGARVVLASAATARDGERLRRAVEHHRPSLLQATPAGWQLLLASGWRDGAKLTALVGGEAVGAELARELVQRCARVWNLYGPTETTIWSTACRLRAEDRSVSIGEAIANTQAYVLDAWMRPVPPGVAGELYLGGAGLARGYWRQPAETAARFVPHPFAAEPGRRLYKTGDRVRRQSDGGLQFLGRFDHQVKLRGFRIELGEIESRLREHPAVGAAAVLLRHEEADRPRLTAYVVARAGGEATEEELRAYLARLLPEYMLPSAWVRLDALPLSPHGKIDRKALPAPTGESAPRPDTEWQTETERQLAQAWREVLHVAEVGRRDNFFRLGGHSLTALKLLARLHQRDIDLPLPDVFRAPDLAALAAIIDEAAASGRSTPQAPIARADRRQEVALSFGQQRLWFIEQLQPDAGFFRVPLAVRLLGPLDREALAQSFRDLMRRHEILRTTFCSRDGLAFQSVQTEAAIDLPFIDLTTRPPEQRQTLADREVDAEARRPFDLMRGPLIRARLVRLEPEQHVLLVTLHHIIADGWSLQVLLRDAVAFYLGRRRGEAPPLPELPVQYVDFAVWQRASLNAEMLGSQAAYWRRQLDNLPRAELPGARVKSDRHSGAGATHALVLPAVLVDRLAALSQTRSTTLFTTLLSAFAVALYSYDGREDVAIGTPVAGRDRVELEDLIGLFINPLVIRARLEGRPTFLEVMIRIAQTMQDGLAHKDLPFEEVVRTLGKTGMGLQAPLFRAWFTFQEMVVPALRVDDIQAEILDSHNGAAMFDLALLLRRSEAAITCLIEYDTDVFTPSTIHGFGLRFQELLQAVSSAPQQTLPELRRRLESVERQANLAAAARFEAADARALRARKRRPEEQQGGEQTASAIDQSTAV
jgi:non-ribosomal peptide synthetase component F